MPAFSQLVPQTFFAGLPQIRGHHDAGAWVPDHLMVDPCQDLRLVISECLTPEAAVQLQLQVAAGLVPNYSAS